MGGSGSTGSSLLKNILNRHPDIFAGGETTLFAKLLPYQNWEKAKRKLETKGMKGMKNHGFHLYNGTRLIQNEYLWKEGALKSMAITTKTFPEFANQYFAKAMAKKNAIHWLEKTPANAACFKYFLENFDDAKVIHITRNPYDTIASLINRGYPLYYAICIYLLNTSSGIAVSKNINVHTVKYENLTNNPKETVSNICDFLNVTYHDKMLIPQGDNILVPKLKGWQYDETEAIGNKSIGRFKKLSQDKQSEIIAAVDHINVNTKGLKYYNIDCKSIKDICKVLDYKYYNNENHTIYKILKSDRRIDKWKRIIRGYQSGIHYPIEIRK